MQETKNALNQLGDHGGSEVQMKQLAFWTSKAYLPPGESLSYTWPQELHEKPVDLNI